MKLYSIQTIKSIKVVISDYISTPGKITTAVAIKIMEKHTFGLSKSSLRNIFSMIMNDLVKAGKAHKEHRGAWMILESHNPRDIEIGSGGKAPKYIKQEFAPVVFDPQLNAFLNPPKPTPEVDVYNELRKLKGIEKTRWQDHAIILCMKAGVSLTKLINYINEKRNGGAIEGCRA